MKKLYRWAITIFIVCIAPTSIAEVVLLTDDKTITLDLTSKEGAAVDLLECGLYVLEEGGNTYLVHSKGKLPVPKLAMKRMMDGGLVEVDTKGALQGLKLVSMLLPYSHGYGKFSTPYKFKDSSDQHGNDGNLFSESSMTFFISASESKIASTIKKKLPKAKLIPSKELGNENVVILLNPAYLNAVGGDSAIDYFLSEWLRKPPLIQIEYQCGIRVEKTANPYFKKQDEVFRFGR
jgi:hypothetical protein